ncbi:hypothetical protein MACH17_06070 [Phaeobacter inhibens]|nr:hypothetical protein MACH17_06070 [Phaeobacter inhibens]
MKRGKGQFSGIMFGTGGSSQLKPKPGLVLKAAMRATGPLHLSAFCYGGGIAFQHSVQGVPARGVVGILGQGE